MVKILIQKPYLFIFFTNDLKFGSQAVPGFIIILKKLKIFHRWIFIWLVPTLLLKLPYFCEVLSKKQPKVYSAIYFLRNWIKKLNSHMYNSCDFYFSNILM